MNSRRNEGVLLHEQLAPLSQSTQDMLFRKRQLKEASDKRREQAAIESRRVIPQRLTGFFTDLELWDLSWDDAFFDEK